MSIVVQNLTHEYNAGTELAVRALHEVSLTLSEGEIVGLMGHTGCGKSTLMQIMAGLIEPTQGTVLADGEDIFDDHYRREKLRSRLGVVFQYPENQLFESTVYRDVAFGLKHSGLSAEEKDGNIRWALQKMGFDPDAVAKLSPLGLSGGEKRRLAIAGVLAVRPAYLILDEPIAGLDPAGRQAFIRLLHELRQAGMAILMISHNADAVAECADRLYLMKQGEIFGGDETGKAFSDEQMVHSCGVEVSSPQRIAAALRQRGVRLGGQALTHEDLMKELAQWLKVRTGGGI